MTCEFQTPCARVVDRDPWCVPCLTSLIESQNDLNERLNDLIERQNAEIERLRGALGEIAGCDTPHCDACQSEYPEDVARDALDNTTVQ